MVLTIIRIYLKVNEPSVVRWVERRRGNRAEPPRRMGNFVRIMRLYSYYAACYLCWIMFLRRIYDRWRSAF